MADRIPVNQVGLKEGAQKEQLTRPTIGGTSQEPRQIELNKDVRLDPIIIRAKADLTAGKISLEQFNIITKRR